MKDDSGGPDLARAPVRSFFIFIVCAAATQLPTDARKLRGVSGVSKGQGLVRQGTPLSCDPLRSAPLRSTLSAPLHSPAWTLSVPILLTTTAGQIYQEYQPVHSGEFCPGRIKAAKISLPTRGKQPR